MKRCGLLGIIAVSLILWAGSAAASDCTSPSGFIGEIILDSNDDVFKGCSTSGWIAFH